MGPLLQAQEDLLSLLDAGQEEQVEYTTASFKTNRVINLHSLESTAGGVFDFKISHRFGFLNGGIYDLFGLDNASIRIGGDYGVSNRLTIGAGRSSYEKTYDGFVKYKFLRQSKGKRKMPLTAAVLASGAIKTVNWPNPDRVNYFSSRLNYVFQVILGRKFSESLTLQLSPTLVHRNLVKTLREKNDVFALGVAGRIKLNRRIALNGEYIYVFPDQLAPGFRNSLSVGFDLETGGHVFQLHFTNSTAMVGHGFITETIGDWRQGGIRFGFNISRVFTVKRPKF
ncbi:MAG: hypothetical protein IPJ40_06785 [Saprospirales bacterium]|nr:hypothetical protein [Saprospirales bacterium]